MLCRKFELILIKIGFFYEFLNLLQNWVKVPCTIVQGRWPNFTRREFSIFITFSDTDTCTYVM